MARYMRTDLQSGHSHLSPPRVIGAGIAFFGPRTRLADPADPIDFALRGRATWNLAPPVVVNAAPAFYGPSVTLATRTQTRDVVRRFPLQGWDGWSVQAEPDVPTLDNFNRPDASPAGPPWVAYATESGLKITSNRIAPIFLGDGAVWNSAAFPANVTVKATGVIFAGVPFLVARSSGPRSSITGYAAGFPATGPSGIRIGRWESGSFVQLVSASYTGESGDLLVFRCFGSTLTAYVYNAEGLRTSLSTTDTTFPDGGYVGLSFSSNPGSLFDDFGASAYFAPTNPGLTKRLLGPRPPAVVFTAAPTPIEDQLKVRTHLTAVRSQLAPHRKTGSRLSRPTVVFPATAPFTASPISTSLASQRFIGTVTRRKPHPKLFPPAVIGAGIVFAPIQVYLDAKSTLNVESPERRARSRLAPPTVVIPAVTAVFSGPTVHLAPQKRGQPKAHLAPPAVVGAGVVFPPVDVHLAPSKAGKPRSELSPPAVVGDGVVFQPVAVTLAPSKHGLPKSLLRPPVLPPLARPVETEIAVQLTRVSLVERRQGSHLFPPPVVGAGIVFRPVEVDLAPSKRGIPKSQLRAPNVVGAGIYFRSVLVHLAPSSRGKPKSQLRPAIIPPLAQPVEEKLAVQLVRVSFVERQPHSRLAPPAVVGAGIYFRGVLVRVAPSTDIPERRRTKAVLHPPTVVASPPASRPPNIIKLAPQRRGQPKSTLHPPAVVGAGIVFRQVRVKLSPGRAGETTSRLFPPTVVFLATELTITTHLAYQTRGKTRSALHPPAVVGAGRVFRPVDVTLAPSKRGLPKSALHGPTVVGVQPFRPLLVHLTPSSRGKTRSLLRPPVAVGTSPFRPILIHLVLGRAGEPTSKLGAPIIPPLARSIWVVLTRITVERRGPHSVLRPPTAVGTSPFAPVRVVLAPSKRGKPSSLLRTPTVVGTSPFRPVQIRLAPSSRGIPRSSLFSPVVVVTNVEPTQGQQTILVKLVALRTRIELLLHKPLFVLFPPGHGRVVKFTTSFPVSAWSLGNLSGSIDTDTPDAGLSIGEPSSTNTEEPESGWTIGGPF